MRQKMNLTLFVDVLQCRGSSMRFNVLLHEFWRFMSTMLVIMIIISILVMWSFGWNWGRLHQAGIIIFEWAVITSFFMAVGILRGYSKPSNGGAPFAAMFRRTFTWPARMDGWQRIVVVLSGVCASWWIISLLYHGSTIPFFGAVAIWVGAFVVISLAAWLLLWIVGLLFRWIKSGFNRR